MRTALEQGLIMKLDGRLRKVESVSELKVGCVIRMIQPSDPLAIPPFSDFVVSAIKGTSITLVRPYCVVTQLGTVFTGLETLDVNENSFTASNSLFREVMQAHGQSFDYTT